ncbi:uncharacterized protein LOC131618669 [Vicia villosa]|uniref:uncharacterized protein LOC131618669 n=1 Tax=Vicia villosa TaxID=3911 RepID=UPI00273BCC6F|nr:uncharacterized protein LOC131618669 [Vicia villosa]
MRRFVELVNSCRIYEEDNIAHSTHYKNLNEKRGKQYHYRKKPYDDPADKGKQKVADGKKTSGGGAYVNVRCYSIQFQKPKKDASAAKTSGRVFHLNGTKDSKKDNLIQGFSFSYMNGSMVIDTPASGYVTTTFVCNGCLLTIFDKRFVMDLACLPLHQIDVILAMNLLEFNYVHIYFYNKTLRFPKYVDNGELMLLTAKQVSECIRDVLYPNF